MQLTLFSQDHDPRLLLSVADSAVNLLKDTRNYRVSKATVAAIRFLWI
jgi:hypothetical protein